MGPNGVLVSVPPGDVDCWTSSCAALGTFLGTFLVGIDSMFSGGDDKGGTGACRFANSIRAFHIAILEVNSSPLRQPPVENIGYGSRNIIRVDRPGASGL